MKRMIMWAIGLLVMVSAANAQLKKGDLLVGGNIGLTLDIGSTEVVSGWGVVRSSTDVDVTFSLSPGVNYMLTDNWYVGGELGLSVAPGGASIFAIGPCGGYYVPFCAWWSKHICNWTLWGVLRAVQQDDWNDEYTKYGIRGSRKYICFLVWIYSWTAHFPFQ